SWTQRVPSALLLATAGEYRQGLNIENRIEPYLSGKMPDAVYRMIEAILPKHPKVELFCQGEPRKRWHKWLAVD
ncbi:MAG TPA: hypothetical protein VMV98_06580, partial [Acidobacteriaceae bacterium]|nr:hypothetical protein [Acidobacteriaceae bacterium]